MNSQSGPPSRGKTRYFSRTGCVIEYPDRRDVFVGGSLIGTFTPDDRPMRNMLIVATAQSEGVRYGKLAEAFGVGVVTVRSVRRQFEKGGVEAIVKPGGKPRKLTPRLVARLGELFDKGLTIDEAHKRIRKRVSRTLVGRAHKQWVDAKTVREREERKAQEEKTRQVTFDEKLVTVTKKTERRASRKPTKMPSSTSKEAMSQVEEEIGLERAAARGGEHVQHLGSWIMLAMLQALGLYVYAEHLRAEVSKKSRRFVGAVALRVALDAVAISLVIGEKTVEGVRRIATPSVPTLLRHRHAITPSWARRILGHFSETAGDVLHMTQAMMLVQQSEQVTDKRVFFYVDNHMRPYTGKNMIRKGWRMRDKRAVPGATDYWVHDFSGRPVFRVHSPEHDSLAKWLRPIGDKLRDALTGKDERRVALVFDRAGAGAQTMAELRDAGFDFITYEKKPYPTLPESAFDYWIKVGDERYEYTEASQKNLRKGRGRVRRIAMRNPEGEQFNILAVSTAPAHEIIEAILARWSCQENQFKHGVERWGINQLDGRTLDEYPPDAIIPNPARSRVERELGDARKKEGEALRRLSRLQAHDPKREKLERDVDRARAEQNELEALRPYVPTHAPVEETELAGKLVKHRRCYKLLIDTLRVGLANAESELAARLAPHLPRGKEAKKTLKNLVTAPGHLRVNNRFVTITLSPAGTPREQEAYAVLLDQLNKLPLTLPGDAKGRRLRFEPTKK